VFWHPGFADLWSLESFGISVLVVAELGMDVGEEVGAAVAAGVVDDARAIGLPLEVKVVVAAPVPEILIPHVTSSTSARYMPVNLPGFCILHHMWITRIQLSPG